MSRLRGTLATFASLLLILVIAGPATASHGEPGSQLPFAMQLFATADEPLDMSPGFPLARDTFGTRCSAASDWLATINSVGRAAHLGRVSVTQSHCTRIDIFTAPPLPAVIGDGHMVVTAANGDELRIDYSGSFLFYPTGEGVGTSVLSYGPMTIAGGTGRFAGASGTIVGRAIDSFPAGPNVADFSGTIVYRASDTARN
jgi:hypothetical protein